MASISRSIGKIIFGKMMPRVMYPVVRGRLKGARFTLGSIAGQGGGGSVYFGMIEPHQTNAFVETLREGQTVLDLGANVGYYSVLASRLVGTKGRVVSFEPSVRNLSLLYRHLRANQAENVMVIPAACSDTHQLALFASGDTYATGHLVEGQENAASRIQVTAVPCLTVDEVVERLDLSPDVMKIDVEGAELDVLKGAAKTLADCQPAIFLSVHSDQLRESCSKLLEELGYVVETINQEDPNELLAKHQGHQKNDLPASGPPASSPKPNPQNEPATASPARGT
ncbi:MAG: FkbM family methyltransferase [Ferruginibacter sp.]|nr:FkbM family methyltransferase [Cytophagales bacterium]